MTITGVITVAVTLHLNCMEHAFDVVALVAEGPRFWTVPTFAPLFGLVIGQSGSKIFLTRLLLGDELTSYSCVLRKGSSFVCREVSLLLLSCMPVCRPKSGRIMTFY
jgi:hypothetical protein